MSIEENLEFLTNSVTSAGALPSQVTPHGGVVIDIVGLNGERVVIQKSLPFAVTGFLSSGFTYDLTSLAGFNQDVLDFLGGGFSEIGLRLSAAIPYGSDSTYGPEFGMGLALNNMQIGNVNDHHSIASNGNGAVLGGEIIDGFLTETHCTTWIHIDDADTLANIYNSALSTQAIDIDAIFYKPPTDTSQVSYSFATDYPPYFSTLDNTAPVPDAEMFEISEDGTLSIDVDQLLDGDTDEDGDILQVVGVKNAINGTVELNQDTGQVSFTPDANFNGIATFDYVVSDGTVNVKQTVTVNVTPVNDAPYVIANPNKPDGHENAVYLQVTEDQDFYISAEDILAQFADVDGDALTIHNYLGRDYEYPYLDDFTVSFFEDGGVAIELSQNLDYFSDSFSVQFFNFNSGYTPLLYVQDTSGSITPVIFYIDIIPVQDAPIAIDDQFSGKVEDGIIRGNLFQDNGFGRDYDPDTGGSFTISNLSVGALDTDIVLPSGAVLRVQANGDFTYDPTNGFTDLDVGQIQNDQFNYTIVDTVGDVSTATVVFDISTGVERFVDLTASDVNLEVGYAGEFGSLSWTIKNQGTKTAVSPWLNAIYVSTDDILDASDTLVDYNSLPIDLGAGDFYSQSVLIEMPEKPGTYYYFVVANDNLALNEIDLDNNVAASGQVTVKPQYRATAYVEQDTTIAGQSFTVSGYSYTQDGAAVPYKLVTVEIDNGLGSTYRNVVTDKNGFFTFDVPSKAETGGDISVRAYFPDYAAEDTEFEDSTHLIGMDFGRGGYNIDTISGTQKQYSFEIQNLSNVGITGLDIDISGIPNDWISDISVPEVLQADGSAVVYLTLDVPSDSQNQNLNAQITLTSDIGAVTSANVTVQNHVPKAELTVDTPKLEYGMLLGDVTFVTFTVENTGGAHSGPLTLDLPDVPWITLLSATNAQGLAPGDVSKITLALAPDSTLDIAKYQGALSVNAGGANVSIPFEFNAVSNETGTLAIEVTDQFTYFDPDAPLVENASIKIVNPITQEVIYDGKDEDGSLILNDLPSGYYDISISADEHGKFQKTVKVQSGETNDVLAFIPIQLVQYKWTVTQTETDDRYVVDINTTFKTSVPAPVIVIDPPVIDLFELQNYGDELVVDFTITNHGLIATNDVNLNFSDNPNYEITMPFDQLDRLDGQSSVTIPVTIKYVPEFIADDQQTTSRSISFDNCSLTYVVNHAYSCGKEDIIASEKGSAVNLWDPQTNTLYGDCSFDSVVNASSSTSGGPGENESGNSWISASSGGGYSGDCGCDPAIFTTFVILLATVTAGPIGGTVLAIGLIGVGAISAVNAIGVFLPPGRAKDIFKWVSISASLLEILNCSSEESSSDYSSKSGAALATPVTREIILLREYFGVIEKIASIIFTLKGTNEARKSDEFANAISEIYTSLIESAEAESLISLETFEAILSDHDLTAEQIELAFTVFERFNNTLAEDKSSANYIDFEALDFAMQELASIEEAVTSLGYNSLQEFLEDTFSDALQLAQELSNENVCAEVALEISQDAVMSRQAFDATLNISNGSAQDITDFAMELVIYDEAGNVVDPSLFAIQIKEITNVSGVDGSGIIAAGDHATVTFELLPSDLAAGADPTDYRVGGQLSYNAKGYPVVETIFPDQISVLPQPELRLDYFHSRVAYGDDPLTTEIETSQPYQLAMLVRNDGYGVANNFEITTHSPEIINNEMGLIVDFDILSTDVNGVIQDPSLTVNFGNISAGQTALAIWNLQSSLHGTFQDFSIDVTQSNPLGLQELDSFDEKFSFIKESYIHELVHVVKDDRYGADEGKDFLVNDIFDIEFAPDKLYLSDGSVEDVSKINAIQEANSSELSTVVDVTSNQGWNYFTVVDQFAEGYKIASITRSDGKVLTADNFWQTDRTFGLNQEPTWEDKLHIFDYSENGGSHQYTVVYELIAPLVVPILNDDKFETELGEVITGNLFADNGDGADQNVQEIVSINGITDFEDRIITLDNGSKITVTKNGDFTLLAGASVGLETISYSAKGSQSPVIGNAVAEFDIRSGNRAPEASDITYKTFEDAYTIVGLDQYISDLDGDPLSLVSIGSPLHGAVDIFSGSFIVYRPEANFFGTDSFTYTISDGQSLATGTITLDIQAVNDAPQQIEFFMEDGAELGAIVSLDMSGHVDIDGDPLTVLSVTGEYNGAALMGNVIDNIVTFDPSQLADVLGAGEVADVTLNYTWTDGKTDSSGHIRLNVIGDAAVSASTEFADRLVGSNLDDSIDSLAGNDFVYALAGDDVVVAGAGRDHVFGGDGNDVVFGGDGNDVIYGDAGSDKIYGQSGVDLMFGGQGDDILNGGTGNDWLIGGDGSDSFVFEVDRDEVTAAEVDNIFDWQTGQDTLLFDLGKMDSDVNFDFGAINLLDYATVFSGYVEIDVQSLMFNEIGLLSNAHTVNVYGINGQSDLDYLSHSFNFVV